MGGGGNPARDAGQLGQRLDAARTAMADLRAATREANEATAGLRELLGEWRQLLDELRPGADARIDAAVSTGLADYEATLEKAISDASGAVFRRFDTMVETLLGEGEGGEPLEDTLRRFRQRVAKADARAAYESGAPVLIQADPGTL